MVAVADPSPSPPAGAIVEVDLTDLPAGFEAIPFFHDVPGLLRDLDDEILGALGERARLPGQSAGQGFASADSGELAFVITITLDTAADAQRVIRYLTTLPAEGILGFISPDETLFENEQRRDPAVGDAAVQYSCGTGWRRMAGGPAMSPRICWFSRRAAAWSSCCAR